MKGKSVTAPPLLGGEFMTRDLQEVPYTLDTSYSMYDITTYNIYMLCHTQFVIDVNASKNNIQSICKSTKVTLDAYVMGIGFNSLERPKRGQ